jgi:hypothetical protein
MFRRLRDTSVIAMAHEGGTDLGSYFRSTLIGRVGPLSCGSLAVECLSSVMILVEVIPSLLGLNGIAMALLNNGLVECLDA